VERQRVVPTRVFHGRCAGRGRLEVAWPAPAQLQDGVVA